MYPLLSSHHSSIPTNLPRMEVLHDLPNNLAMKHVINPGIGDPLDSLAMKSLTIPGIGDQLDSLAIKSLIVPGLSDQLGSLAIKSLTVPGISDSPRQPGHRASDHP